MLILCSNLLAAGALGGLLAVQVHMQLQIVSSIQEENRIDDERGGRRGVKKGVGKLNNITVFENLIKFFKIKWHYFEN